jgi:hypothetical protein
VAEDVDVDLNIDADLNVLGLQCGKRRSNSQFRCFGDWIVDQ